MLRTFVILVGIGVCIVTLTSAISQHRELASLHEQERQLRQQAMETTSPVQTAASVAAPQVEEYAPSAELLRLRGEVGLLERRKRELTDLRKQNDALRVQLASKGTNAPGGIVLPPGYIRKTEARYAGYNTPEDTLQSFLWAVQNRDVKALLESFTPEAAKQLEGQIQRRGSPKEFFEEANAIPGFLIAGRKLNNDGSIELEIEFLPGTAESRKPLQLQLINGQWKITSL